MSSSHSCGRVSLVGQIHIFIRRHKGAAAWLSAKVLDWYEALPGPPEAQRGPDNLVSSRDLALPLPVPHDRPVSLAEKCAALVAVYEQGTPKVKINPWEARGQSPPEAYVQLCGLPGRHVASWCRDLGREDLFDLLLQRAAGRAGMLSHEDEDELGRWLSKDVYPVFEQEVGGTLPTRRRTRPHRGTVV